MATILTAILSSVALEDAFYKEDKTPLSRYFGLIVDAREKGISYEQLLSKTKSLVSTGRNKDYFPSYNCRKLVRLGLISAQQKVDKKSKSWSTSNILKHYAEDCSDNLLAKRDDIVVTKENAEIENVPARDNWSKNCAYDTRLSWDQNIMRLFVASHAANKSSLTVKELMLCYQKKAGRGQQAPLSQALHQQVRHRGSDHRCH